MPCHRNQYIFADADRASKLYRSARGRLFELSAFQRFGIGDLAQDGGGKRMGYRRKPDRCRRARWKNAEKSLRGLPRRNPRGLEGGAAGGSSAAGPAWRNG